MTWIYSQATGQLRRGGRLIATGYSGLGEHKNKPAAEALKAKGPIPRGRWAIGAPYDSAKVGPFALVLTPIDHDAHGRTAFRIHGDSSAHPGAASNGCIILARKIREQIWAGGDRELEVTA